MTPTVSLRERCSEVVPPANTIVAHLFATSAGRRKSGFRGTNYPAAFGILLANGERPLPLRIVGAVYSGQDNITRAMAMGYLVEEYPTSIIEVHMSSIGDFMNYIEPEAGYARQARCKINGREYFRAIFQAYDSGKLVIRETCCSQCDALQFEASELARNEGMALANAHANRDEMHNGLPPNRVLAVQVVS